MTWRSLVICVASASLLGCNRGPAAPYPTWASADPPYVPHSGSGNAFDGYVTAAEDAVSAAPTESERVSFLSGMKAATLSKLTKVVARVEHSTKLPCTFDNRVENAFGPGRQAKGWRLIGRALVWKIEASAQSQDLVEACHWYLVATKFGFDLTQGDAQTATLGFTVCNEARRAFAPVYQQLSAEQLTNLFGGLSSILSKYGGLGHTVLNEQKHMLLGIQFVQDARQSGKYEVLQKALGRDARQAIAYLKNLDESKRPAYFEALASATKSFADHWATEIDKPRPDRAPWVAPEDSGTYRRFADAFTGTIEPLSSIADVCLARTRILALSARAWARVKSSNLAPKDLRGLPRSLVTDPFSGNSFVYNASGPDFRVYSVGVNNRDDGGDSDDAGESPDLVLEGNGL